MSNKYLVGGLLFCCMVSSSAFKADTLGLYVSASNWSPDISGTIDNTGPAIDLVDTLGYSDEDATRLSVRFEHPLPVLPNLGLERYDLDSSSTATLSEIITYNGTVYNINDTVNSQLDLSHQSVLLYYEVLDNWVNLDIGLDIMLFDGQIELESSTDSNMTDLDETIPALYAMFEFDFPLTGLTAGAALSYIGYDDNDITKSRLFVAYESEIGLGVEAGVQTFDAEWEDINLSNGNLSFDGAYASITFHF